MFWVCKKNLSTVGGMALCGPWIRHCSIQYHSIYIGQDQLANNIYGSYVGEIKIREEWPGELDLNPL